MLGISDPGSFHACRGSPLSPAHDYFRPESHNIHNLCSDRNILLWIVASSLPLAPCAGSMPLAFLVFVISSSLFLSHKRGNPSRFSASSPVVCAILLHLSSS